MVFLLDLHLDILTVLLLVEVTHLTVCVLHPKHRVTEMLLCDLFEDPALIVDLVLGLVDVVVESVWYKEYFWSPMGSRKALAVHDCPTRPALPISWNISFMLRFCTKLSVRITFEIGKLVP